MVVGVTPGALAVLPVLVFPDWVVALPPEAEAGPVVGLELAWLLLPHPAATSTTAPAAASQAPSRTRIDRDNLVPPDSNRLSGFCNDCFEMVARTIPS
jgi:hypothetical protein